jgi:2-amino-4-hydroxy-6-hydroxymethyldihydropteridine diphosphokinase
MVFIAIGSNIQPLTNIKDALHLMAKELRLSGLSTFYESPPIGSPGSPWFVNGVVAVRTALPPRRLKFGLLREIERKLGRVRSEDLYAPRTIDLDIIVYEGVVVREPDLVIPDPEIVSRSFLAIPLYELAPHLVISGIGTLREIVEGMHNPELRPLVDFTRALREEFEDK